MLIDMARSYDLADILRVAGALIIVASWLVAGHRIEMWLHRRAPGAVRPGFVATAGLIVGLIMLAAAVIT